VATLLLASCGGSTATPPVDAAGDVVTNGDAGPTLTPAELDAFHAGLAAAWAFDDDGSDHSPSGLDLQIGRVPFTAGRFGKALLFTGDGTAIAQRPRSDATLDLAAGDFTVTFWLAFAKTPFPQFVAVKGYNSGGWFVGWAQTQWVFRLSAAGSEGKFSDPAGTPATGVYHHVVLERAGDTARYYVDGALVGTAAVTDGPTPAASNFQVGGYSPGGGATGESAVHGNVDDLAIWHRALTDVERGYLDTHAVP
jgi:hypothetical protein